MNIVLFLGAGFSKAFGLPVMNEFFTYANSLEHLKDEEKAFLMTLQEDARHSHATLSGDDGNLEHVLSLASVRDMEDGTTKFTTCCEILAKAFSLPSASFSDSDLREHFQSLLGITNPSADPALENNKITIITTNYDLIPEFGLSMLGIAPNIVIKKHEQGMRRPDGRSGVLYGDASARITLCKIHGSTNWHFDEASDSIVIDDAIMPGPRNRETRPRSWIPGHVQSAMIVPPTFFKPQWHKSIEPVWKAAKQALASATKIIFIGYSFPASDTHMRYLVGSALSKNYALKSFVIVDPQASSIAARLRERPYYFGDMVQSRFAMVDKVWQSNFSLELGEPPVPMVVVKTF